MAPALCRLIVTFVLVLLAVDGGTAVEPCFSEHHPIPHGVRDNLSFRAASADGSAGVRDKDDVSLPPENYLLNWCPCAMPVGFVGYETRAKNGYMSRAQRF